MKKLICILFFLCSFANVFSQKDSLVETIPDFSGGMSQLMNYLQTNIIYPMNAKENGIMGKPLFRFLIDSMGNIGDIEVRISSGNIELDNEGKRVISKMPKWKPGSLNGKNVSVHFNLPVNFVLGPLTAGQRNEYNILWKNKYIDYYYAQGVKEFKENKLNDALSSFENALKEYANDIDVLYNKSATLIKLDRINEACETLNKIKKLGKPDGDELIAKYCANYTPAPIDTNLVYTVVEKMPEYPGGTKSLFKFVEQNFDYSKSKNEKYEYSNVSLIFVVNRQGNVENVKILRSCGNAIIDKEAIRVISSITGWEPGVQNGKKVKVYYNLPVSVKKV